MLMHNSILCQPGPGVHVWQEVVSMRSIRLKSFEPFISECFMTFHDLISSDPAPVAKHCQDLMHLLRTWTRNGPHRSAADATPGHTCAHSLSVYEVYGVLQTHSSCAVTTTRSDSNQVWFSGPSMSFAGCITCFVLGFA